MTLRNIYWTMVTNRPCPPLRSRDTYCMSVCLWPVKIFSRPHWNSFLMNTDWQPGQPLLLASVHCWQAKRIATVSNRLKPKVWTAYCVSRKKEDRRATKKYFLELWNSDHKFYSCLLTVIPFCKTLNLKAALSHKWDHGPQCHKKPGRKI